MTAGIFPAPGGNGSSPPDESVERRYRQLLDHSPDPMCVHADGRVVYVNPAAVRCMAANSADELVGRLITDFVHPDSIAPMLARIAALKCEGDSSEPSEAVMLRLDGSPVDAEVVSVLTSWDGKPAYQVAFRDLTLLKAAAATLHHQAMLLTHTADAVIATTTTGMVTSWNGAAEKIYRRSAACALTLPISEAVGAAVDAAAIIAAGGVEHATHYDADGTAHTIRVAAAAVETGYVFVCSDNPALQRAERRFQTVVNSVDEGLIVVDAGGHVEWVNPAARHILGLPPDGDLPDRFDFIDAQCMAETLRANTATRDQIVRFDRPDGMRRWLCASCRPLDRADVGHLPTLLVTFTDITEQRHAQQQLTHQAQHDALTGLPNRSYAEARASQALNGEPPALAAAMFIDLDNVKTLNDTFGHQAGDTVITTAAQRMRSALRAEDFIARLGGDEFIALIFGHADRPALQQMADRLHAALAAPLIVAGNPCRLTASIGVAMVEPHDHRDAARILQDADAAMYKAKAHRGATHYAEDR